ncbi:hypothetical protein M422DRAFT_275971 [Sphaerobolus stellatus SS14]|uniref:Uncharacterized protein n=1 Tax=Sphaerobolus stellatus (strain SS14) TaxID=990650 RepID=A0A0C9UE74_SPHS4|nr:hypothetical protein M422DRAFT_275971 [Sphaerobolus stellatus SS14]
MPKDPPSDAEPFQATSNGFINSIFEAYCGHHKLVIRPNDVWIAIRKNSEKLRNSFVSHEGKVTLSLRYEANRHTVDYNVMAKDFADSLKEMLKEPSFHDFILPDFSTTTPNDTATSCGIPQITLLGTKEDYFNILRRLEKLQELNLGAKPQAFAALLKPVVKQFI